MHTIDELVSEFHTLSPSDQKAFLRIVSPRGAVAVSRDKVHRQTWEYLTQSATIEGEFYDEWLMNLSREDLEALRQRPTPEELYELEAQLKKRKENELTEEDLDRVTAGPPQHTLSLLAWLWTAQGWAVYKRDRLEVFLKWATLQTEKLIHFTTMTNDGFMIELRQRLGREKGQGHPPKGDLLKYGRDAKGEFLMAACFGWRNKTKKINTPQTLLLRKPEDYYRLQHDYLNSGRDIMETTLPHQPKYRIYRHPSYLHFVRISK